MASQLFIGLMSGTSTDAIDATLVSFDQNSTQLIATHSTPMPAEIKSALTQLMQGDHFSLQLLGETDTKLAHLFSETCLALLKKAGKKSSDITAIGSHGQTIYHHPHSEHPFTLQIADPNIIAARTSITTVADFRRRDMAQGGQGAPLTPAFHAYLFGRKNDDQWILNLGGIANVTWLPKNTTQSIIGFDTGPANTLLDLWHQRHRQHAYDKNGQWARTGKLNTALLAHLLDDSYFAKNPPKSTGREYFNLHWLDKKLSSHKTMITPVDVQCTLTELTAVSIANAIHSISTQRATLWICGGGINNNFLIERLSAHCPEMMIHSTSEAGIDPQWIESAAFAWLAKQTLEKKPGNCPSVTGAKNETILGAIFYESTSPLHKTPC